MKSAPKTIFSGNGNGLKNFIFYMRTKECSHSVCGVSWPSGLAYRTRVLVLAAECGFESRS